MDAAIDRLRTYWNGQPRLRLERGLEGKDLRNFESKIGVELPSDFVACLMLANGFLRTDGFENLDENGFEYFGLDLENIVGSDYLIFMSWPYGMLRYCIRLRPGASIGQVFLLNSDLKGGLISQNFSDFVELYLADDRVLYGGGLKVAALP